MVLEKSWHSLAPARTAGRPFNLRRWGKRESSCPTARCVRRDKLARLGRQREVKHSASAGFAANSHVAAVSFDEFFDDGQTEANAVGFIAVGRVLIKYVFELFGRNAGPIVRNQAFDRAIDEQLRADVNFPAR